MVEKVIDYLLKEIIINSKKIDELLQNVQDLERANDKILKKLYKIKK